jgi:hypothetical protein
VDPGRKLNDFERQIVEAVGIEPSSEHPVRHDSVAIAGSGALGETLVNPREPELEDHPWTRVPSVDSVCDCEWVRRVWGALRVV